MSRSSFTPASLPLQLVPSASAAAPSSNEQQQAAGTAASSAAAAAAGEVEGVHHISVSQQESSHTCPVMVSNSNDGNSNSNNSSVNDSSAAAPVHTPSPSHPARGLSTLFTSCFTGSSSRSAADVSTSHSHATGSGGSSTAAGRSRAQPGSLSSATDRSGTGLLSSLALLLSAADADVNVRNAAGFTPIVFAAMGCAGQGDVTVRVLGLLTAAAMLPDPNVRDADGRPALALAVAHLHEKAAAHLKAKVAAMERLLQAGADPNLVDKHGMTHDAWRCSRL